MNNSVKHILVTGSHRSGTTWIGKTIAQHSKIKYIEEPFNVAHPNQEIRLKLNTWFTHYPSSEQQDDIKRTFDKLFIARSLRQQIMHICKSSHLGIRTLFSLSMLQNIGSLERQLLVKDPIALLSAGWLYETYDLNVICMIRSPLGFVGSLKKAGWDFDFNDLRKQKDLMDTLLKSYSTNIDEICKKKSDFIDRACLLWNILHFCILEYRKNYSQWLFVNYDKIAVNPEEGFKEIFNFLDLKVGNHIQDYIRDFTSNANPAETISNNYQPRNSKEIVENWRSRLSPEEIIKVETATKHIASQL